MDDEIEMDMPLATFKKTTTRSCRESIVGSRKDITNSPTSSTAKNEQTTFQCKLCKRLLVSKTGLRIHMDLHVGYQLFECAICSKKYNNGYRLSEHVTKIHKLEIIELQVKEATAAKPNTESDDLQCNDSEMKRRTTLSTTAAIKPLKCSVCAEQFYTVKAIRIHVRVHKDDNRSLYVPLQPRRCLVEQPEPPRKPEPRIYKCNICERVMGAASTLREHKLRHSDANKKLACSQCPKRFYRRTELKCHESTHFNDRPHLCPDCGRSFIAAGKLNDHIRRIHQKERGNHCTICGKSFFYKSRLELHIASVHQDQRPLKCSECDASFKQRNALKAHMKLHANKREYKCQFCDSAFNQKPGLHSHMRTRHFLEPSV